MEQEKKVPSKLSKAGDGQVMLPSTMSASSLEAMENVSMQWESLAAYCRHHGGSHVISRILIANNGIAAVKCIRSLRRWTYAELGVEHAITFVCMATPDDIQANAEFVQLADEIVQVPGGPNSNNYANVDLVVDLAERKGVDAVWAGWGHASENPQLPLRLSKARRKIAFLGPGSKAMHDLGDKVGSSIIAQSAGVPCIAWSGSHVTLDKDSIAQGKPHIPEDMYLAACVSTVEQALEAADKVGYPMMVKASEGGGGKGIRKVTCREDLPSALLQVQSEIVGSPIFLMKLFSGGRHIEVQVLADSYGGVVTLNGRDCSIQRRHQKIIEEGPPIAADPDAFRRMEQAASDLARAVGYEGVGTVEYLYKNGEFFFLEMNPRLQVEHTVTEMINDVNLPLAMLLVGMGVPLHRIPDVRSLYNLPDRHGQSPIDFSKAVRGDAKRYVIAARITAENPSASFRPTSGLLQELNFRNSPHVWGYFSVFGRGAVHEFSDSQFGHIFASGGSRESARKHLIIALKEMTVYGEIRTTINYLAKMLEMPDYIQNNISTEWLDGLLANDTIALNSAGGPMRFINIVCGAVVKASSALNQLRTDATIALDYGRVPPASTLCTTFAVELVVEGIKYCIKVTCVDSGMYALEMNNSFVCADTRLLSDDRLLVFVDGKSHTVFTREEASGLRMQINGNTVIFEQDNDPSKLKASTTGKLVRFLVPNGEHVEAGTPFADLEVMKMYMQLVAAHSGTIRHVAPEESYVKAGDILANLELDDASAVTTAEVFTGEFPAFSAPHLASWRCHQHLRDAVRRAEAVLSGFSDPAFKGEALHADIVNQLFACLKDHSLPYLEIQEAFQTCKAALPSNISSDISHHITMLLTPLLKSPELRPLMSDSSNGFDPDSDEHDRRLVECCKFILSLLAPLEGDSRIQVLFAAVRRHADGQQSFVWNQVISLLEKYVVVEGKFSGMLDRREEVITKLVKSETQAANLDPGLTAREARQLACRNVYQALVANAGIKAKSDLLIHIVTRMQSETTAMMPSRLTNKDASANHAPGAELDAALARRMLTVLHELEELRGQPYAKVAVEARQLLMGVSTPSVADRQKILYKEIEGAVFAWQKEASDNKAEGLVKGYRSYGKHLSPMVQSVHSIFEELSTFMSPKNPHTIRFACLELFVRRSHRQYSIERLSIADEKMGDADCSLVEFWFKRQTHSTVMQEGKMLSSHGSDEAFENNVGSPLAGVNQRRASPSMGGSLKKKSYKRSDSSFGGFTDSIMDLQEMAAKVGRELDSSVEGDDDDSIQEVEYPWRYVLMVVFGGIGDMEANLEATLKSKFRPESTPHSPLKPFPHAFDDESSNGSGVQGVGECIHVLNIMVTSVGKTDSDQAILDRSRCMIQSNRLLLQSLNISRVTLIILRKTGYPGFHTFREHLGYEEDLIYRHLNPPRAFQIEIGRLGLNYDIRPVADGPIINRHIHTFLATQKKAKSGMMTRFFVRALVHGRVLEDPEDCRNFVRHEMERMLLECCDSLALSKGFVEKQTGMAVAYNHFGTLQMCNHLLLAIVPQLHLSRHELIDLLQALIEKNQSRLRQVGVIEVEIPVSIVQPPDDEKEAAGMQVQREAMQMRVIFSNPSGHKVQTNAYLEVLCSSSNFKLISGYQYKSFPHDGKAVGPLDGQDVLVPYPPINQLDLKRLMAKGKETTYVYDFLTLFEAAATSAWAVYQTKCADSSGKSQSFISKLVSYGAERLKNKPGVAPPDCFSAQEYKLGPNDETLEPVHRPVGQNDIGMIVWRIAVKTPECPQGREFILISNDSTVQNGSFGVREDQAFLLATKMAQAEGIPRIYIAANSGARIGLVEDVKSKFRVQWNDPLNPASGLEFLYLDEESVDVLTQKGMAQTEVVTAKDGTKKHKITAVIGPDGIGVENLQGSGKIAGITSRAYNDIFTLTFVSGTSVGIGAYLVRLGQRAIQKGPPILLTGEAALNKVLGKAVYTSNYQLGGTQIMYANGVTHQTVDNDLTGVQAILNWLSFVPHKKGAPLPILMTPQKKLLDPIERFVYDPRRGPNPESVYDPRLLLTGATDAIGKWRGGLFDDATFEETLSGWGMSTICGRARLGGIPVGIVMPEARTVTTTYPADPADSDSKEKTSSQAGLVWFPDSAYKTATAIKDFNLEGLPLMVLANWRGFSGGMRDMFEEILKFGAMIVDNLVDYKQPVFVYIPPNGELRGGAWVVVDPTINPDMMECYVDTSARGGILEPSGIVEIKYRHHHLLETMARLDPVVAALNMRLANAADHERASIAPQLKARQEQLLPMYSKVAEQFADLHDVPARMLAKGCIHGVVPWKWSRQFFHARLRRRIAENAVLNKLAKAEPGVERAQHKQVLQELIKKDVKDLKARMPSFGNVDDHLHEHEQGATSNKKDESVEDKRMSTTIERDVRIADLLSLEKPVVAKLLQDVQHSTVRASVRDLVGQDAEAALEGFTMAAGNMSIEMRQAMLKKLMEGMSQTWAKEGRGGGAGGKEG